MFSRDTFRINYHHSSFGYKRSDHSIQNAVVVIEENDSKKFQYVVEINPSKGPQVVKMQIKEHPNTPNRLILKEGVDKEALKQQTLNDLRDIWGPSVEVDVESSKFTFVFDYHADSSMEMIEDQKIETYKPDFHAKLAEVGNYIQKFFEKNEAFHHENPELPSDEHFFPQPIRLEGPCKQALIFQYLYYSLTREAENSQESYIAGSALFQNLFPSESEALEALEQQLRRASLVNSRRRGASLNLFQPAYLVENSDSEQETTEVNRPISPNSTS